MTGSFRIRLTGVLLILTLAAGLLPAGVAAEPGFVGKIGQVDLVLEQEPALGTVNGITWENPLFRAAPAEEATGFEVGPTALEYDSSRFKNGVAWYDETEHRYLSTSSSSEYGRFHLLHEYRVEIVVHVTGSVVFDNKPNERGWFAAYGEGDDWSSAVTATVNGKEAAVRPYRDYSVGLCLLISYTFGPTLPKSKNDIWIVEGHIDAPRGGRMVSFDAGVGDYAGRRYQGYYHVDDTVTSGDRIRGVIWHDDTADVYLKEGDVFVTGHDYTVLIRFHTDSDNQSFAPRTAFFNGQEQAYVWYGDRKVCFIEHTFTNVREAPPDYPSAQIYGLAGPLAGLTPALYPRMTVTCDHSPGSLVEIVPSDSPYFFNDVCWVYSDTYSPVPLNAAFQKGERYTLILTIRTYGDFRFVVDHTDEGDKPGLWVTYIPQLGDEVISTRMMSPSGTPDREAYLYIDFPPCKEIVKDLSFTAQTPKEGERINTSVQTSDSAACRTRNVVWFDDTAEHVMESGEVFEADHRYSLQFEVYVLSNGSYLLPATYGELSAEGNYVTVNDRYDAGRIEYKSRYVDGDAPWYSFFVVADMGVCNDSVIEELALQITPPTAGALPRYDARVLGSGYHVADREGSVEEYWNTPKTYRYYMRRGVQWSDLDSPAGYTYEDEPFIAGHRYVVTVHVDADEGYEFAHDRYYEALASATVNGEEAELVPGGSPYVTHQEVSFVFTCGEATGYTISGRVTSADAPDMPATVALWRGGQDKPEQQTVLYGTAAVYAFTGLPAGSYILTVSKEGYLPVNRTLTVTDGNLTADATLQKAGAAPSPAAAPGDINADGAVNASDALLALQHSVRLIVLEGTQAVAADVNGDQQINAADALLILQYSVKLIDRFPVEG